MRHLLVNGALQPGGQVPTVRQLAIDLGVHFNTVAQAYRLLADEGWLDLKRRRGATVLDRRKPTAPSKARQNQSLQRLRELIAQIQSEGINADQIASKIRKMEDKILEGECKINMNTCRSYSKLN